ncbi:hypothetical protein FRC15_011526 [Serendipita sp. 397]|nr:hypothetical protein FRC15_011526 [Serendipita sp. 397]
MSGNMSRTSSSGDEITITCLFLGHRPSEGFSIDIGNKKTVSSLKQEIAKKRPDVMDNIIPDKLELFHGNISTVQETDKQGKLGCKTDDQITAAIQEFMQTNPEPERGFIRLDRLLPLGDECIHFVFRIPDNVEPPYKKRRVDNAADQSSAVDTSISYNPDKLGKKRKPRARHSGENSKAVSPDWCLRQDTVEAIFQLLLKYRLVQVRGTPASGKTTLLDLLHAHILETCKDADIIIHRSWPESKLKSRDDRLEVELPGYPSFKDKDRFFLFDEGQTSYWDTELWQCFKDTVQRKLGLIYVIIFCSHGNENVRDPNIPTPLGFDAKVTLERVENGASKSYGLRLDEGEFRDVLGRQRKLHVADDLCNFIYEFTRGHVGHTMAFTDFLVKKRERSMLNGHEYRLEEFREDNPSFHDLCTHLVNYSTVFRGLPPNRTLYASAMKALLLHSKISFDAKDIDLGILSKLSEAHKLGYIDLSVDGHYDFASPLIRQLWSWHLLPDADYQLPYSDLFSFVEATVALFRPSQLTGSDRRVGASDHRPPEAQYQIEYYRCVHQIADGNVGISPEYAAAVGSRAGRIDFFIPSKKWGIELTRDGSKLNDHASRFEASGAYGQWLATSDMVDYVLLDFRHTKPKQSYPGIMNLYHVVFDGDLTRLKIYDNALHLRAESNLLEHH